MKKIISVVGARPNFIKIAPLCKQFEKYKDTIVHLLCHTGQHFDKDMSKVFFDELELPEPDFYLGVECGSHAQQTANIMLSFEKVLLEEKPDLVIVVGDVNSTLACSLVASKLMIKVAHVEAGLRSFDRTMPEEINRLVTDAISDYLFVSEKSGLINLKNEGVPDQKVIFAGNIMIDSLVYYMSKIDSMNLINQLNLVKNDFILCTFHRPSNVDTQDKLTDLIGFLNELSQRKKVVFPIHPRTRKNIEKFGLNSKINKNIILTEPVGYIEFLSLVKNSFMVITDSGGIQEETTFLGIQCITVRNNTERPVTVEIGTNHLAGTDFKFIIKTTDEIISGKSKPHHIPEFWDGNTARRIIEFISKVL